MPWLTALAWAHAVAMIASPHVGRMALPLKRLAFWVGAIVAALYACSRWHVEAGRFDIGDLVLAACLGLLAALAAFSLADFSLRRGVNRFRRLSRWRPRRSDAAAMGSLFVLAAYEELIWRGLVQDSIGGIAGVLIAAVGFSLAHLSDRQRQLRFPLHLDLITLSLVCSTAYALTSTIAGAVAVHAVRNYACHRLRFDHDPAYRAAAQRVLAREVI